ncbi:MAG: hypothetical protein H7X91_10965 [Burkholderiales bacterium]|nr:hypothetical protein [Burkholderiales bacterium]
MLLPQKLYASRGHRRFMLVAYYAALFGLLFSPRPSFSFSTNSMRAYFVAVEYLIYPYEVFVNVWQSYRFPQDQRHLRLRQEIQHAIGKSMPTRN